MLPREPSGTPVRNNCWEWAVTGQASATDQEQATGLGLIVGMRAHFLLKDRAQGHVLELEIDPASGTGLG